MIARSWRVMGLVLVVAGCGRHQAVVDKPPAGEPPVSTGLPVLRDVSDTLPEWRHDKAGSIDKHLPETMTGGGGFVDFDGDGDLDIYLVQSANYPGRPVRSDRGNVLFRREADGTYHEVAHRFGVDEPGYGFGCQAADIDNDGDQDLFVTNLGANVLLRNDGDTFRSMGADAGLTGSHWSTSAAFLDYDNDGRLDLYVCNYLAYDADTAPVCHASDGKSRSYCSPTQFAGVDDQLYHNLGDGRFADVSAAAGITGQQGKGLGVCAVDVDGDGKVDLLVANDTSPTLLFRNRGDGTLVEDGLRAGISRSEDGVARAGMGIDAADVDGDGRADVVVTNFGAEVNALYTGQDGGWFQERSYETGFGAPSYPFLGFGIVLSDFDWDGDLDVLIANGHVLDTVDRSSRGQSYRQRPLVFLNDGGRFREVGEQLGPTFTRGYAGRGLATGDIDGDGDEDFLLMQVDDRPVLLRNDTPRAGAGVVLELRGTRSNRDAIGARVEVTIGERRIARSVLGGRSYLSMHDRRLAIGLGAATRIDAIRITWPSGQVDELKDLPVNVRLRIEEGSGVTATEPLPKPSA